jgi:chemotaxis protein methyltransferase CheR
MRTSASRQPLGHSDAEETAEGWPVPGGRPATGPIGAAEVAGLRELLRGRLGLTLPRGANLARAAQRAADELRLAGPAELTEVLHRRPYGEPLEALVAALNIGETHFYRDTRQIRALEERILPELIAARRPERRLRVWSAGCSTGEEPYTLAMLIHRLLPDRSHWDVLILGTDISIRSLETARRGLYRNWSLRGMPDAARLAYLRSEGDGVRVAPRIRAMVRFERLNLAAGGYPALIGAGPMDLILCRNVLLYFDEAVAGAVVSRLRDALRDAGWLLLSQVEAGLAERDGLAPTDVGAAFRRTDRGVAPAPTAPSPPAPSAVAPSPAVASPTVPSPTAPSTPAPAAGAADEGASGLAVQLWRDGRPADALAWLAGAAAEQPLRSQVHYLTAMILLDTGRDADALAAFRRCTYADPSHAPAHLGQAALLARLGEQRRAATELAEAVRLVADRAPDQPIVAGTDLRVGELRELAAIQHRLLIDKSPGPCAGEAR